MAVLSAGAALRYPSPLRYPGGKGKLSNFVKLLLVKNNLVGAEYIEAYAGGASVALSLLFEDYVSDIQINDIDRSVHAFWLAVLDQTDKLCDRISKANVTVDEWRRQRAIQLASAPDPLDLAFSTFFLNRTNRSGIIAGAGVIGGLDQRGEWGIDARFDKSDLIRRIKKVARFRNRIHLTCLNAADLLRASVSTSPATFVYLDPPYYRKGPALYANFYTHEHHVEIAELVRNLRVPWLVSYDDVPEVARLYKFARRRRYTLDHTAGQHRVGSEIVFFSETLRVPRAIPPAHVPAEEVDRQRLSKTRS